MSIVAFSHHICHYWKVFLSGTSYLYSHPYSARCAVLGRGVGYERLYACALLIWVSRACQLLAMNSIYEVLQFAGSFGKWS